MAHNGRWKSFTSATEADTVARAMGQAYAVQAGKPYPIPPDRYGGGRQPEPRAAYYLEYFVRPIEHLIPAPQEAIDLGGAAMSGSVLFEDLPPSDRELIEPPDGPRGSAGAGVAKERP